MSDLTSSFYIFTFLKFNAFTEAVFSFNLLLSELIYNNINKGVDRLIIEQENLKKFSSFVLLNKRSLISENAFLNLLLFHFCHFLSANSLNLI